jgi:hypothetical protein
MTAPDEPVGRTPGIFPLLGVGAGGAEIAPTVKTMLEAIVDHMGLPPLRRIETVLLLAHTEEEWAVCKATFDRHPRLSQVETASP